MASVQTSSYEGRYLKLTVTQKKGTSQQVKKEHHYK